jgi:RimJ/RimL family protein N-acetyltransferase
MNAPLTQVETEEKVVIAGCVRLTNSHIDIEYLYNFFSSDFMQDVFPDEKKGFAQIHRVVDAFKHGIVFAYAPLMDGDPMGLVYGSKPTDTMALIHWGFWPDKRGGGKRKALANVVFAQIFRDQGVNTVMGLIPTNNRASYAGAYQAGFRPAGVIPNYFVKDGKPCDVHIMILSKESE